MGLHRELRHYFVPLLVPPWACLPGLMTFLYCLWHKEEGCGIGHQRVISDLNLNNTLGASAACKRHSTQGNKQLTISLARLETEGGLTAGGRGRTVSSRRRIKGNRRTAGQAEGGLGAAKGGLQGRQNTGL